MSFDPKRAGCRGGVNASLLPPCGFVAVAVEFAVVAATKRHSELVADLARQRPALGKAQVVRVGRLATAD